MSLQVVLTQVAAVRSLNSMDPGIFSNLIFAILFRKITATEQKFPSVSTAKGTTTEDGDLPLYIFNNLYLNNMCTHKIHST